MLQLTTGKDILHISNPERDARLTSFWQSFVYQVTHVSRKSLAEKLHKIVVVIENFFLRIIVKVGKKFSSVGDVVRGKNIPRNRGAVSFFLKNIEEHKKSL